MWYMILFSNYALPNENTSPLKCFHFSVFPIPLTFAWVITKLYEDKADSTSCGMGYSLLPSYWILEGPRIAAIMVYTSQHLITPKSNSFIISVEHFDPTKCYESPIHPLIW